MASRSGISLDARLGQAVSLLSPVFTSSPFQEIFHCRFSRIEESLSLLREYPCLSLFSAMLLGLSMYSYRVRELLICWLFFCLLFVLLVLLTVAGVVVSYAGKYVLDWTNEGARVTPADALLSRNIQQILPRQLEGSAALLHAEIRASHRV
jgi:hypothetical protein